MVINYREQSDRDDYTIEPYSWVRFAHHKYPELIGLRVLAIGKINSTNWVVAYGGMHHYVHDETDLVRIK